MEMCSDTITEILRRLPVKSVLRFRSVCKSWCNIIDSTFFRESHRRIQSQTCGGDDEVLFLKFSNVWSSWELSTINPDNGESKMRFPAFKEFVYDDTGSNRFIAVGPVDGLICMFNRYDLTLFRCRKGELDWGVSIALYNPCLDKIKILPPSPFSTTMTFENLYEDTSRAHWNVGFGFNSVANDYVVVQLISLSRETHVELYSRRNDAWSQLDFDTSALHQELEFKNTRAIKYVRGGSSVYWRVQRRTEREHRFEYVILSFDLQQKAFGTVSYPDLENRNVDVSSSVVFAKDDDSFSLFVCASNSHTLEVWESRSGGEGRRHWTHARDINILPFVLEFKPLPVVLRKNSVVLVECDHVKCNLVLHDYMTGERKQCEMHIVDKLILEYEKTLISP